MLHRCVFVADLLLLGHADSNFELVSSFLNCVGHGSAVPLQMLLVIELRLDVIFSRVVNENLLVKIQHFLERDSKNTGQEWRAEDPVSPDPSAFHKVLRSAEYYFIV